MKIITRTVLITLGGVGVTTLLEKIDGEVVTRIIYLLFGISFTYIMAKFSFSKEAD